MKLLGPWVVYGELGVGPILCTKWVELSPLQALVSSVGAAIGAPVQCWGCRLCNVEDGEYVHTDIVSKEVRIKHHPIHAMDHFLQ
eukprot:3433163-Ditylum_brightwellii.AAC.1